MNTVTAIAGTFILTLLVGCAKDMSTPPHRVVGALREVGAVSLRHDAEAVARRAPIPQTVAPVEIPETLWTESLRKFRPKHVYWGFSDSLTIVTDRSGDYENGLIVYFPSRSDELFAPGQQAGGGKESGEYKMESGVYWFWRQRG